MRKSNIVIILLFLLNINLLSDTKFNFGKIKYKYVLDENKPNKTYYAVDIPVIEGENKDLIRQIYIDYGIEVIEKHDYSSLNDVINKKCKQFMIEYEETKKEFAEQDMTLNFTFDKSYKFDQVFHILSLQVNEQAYTGGAHGSYSTKYFNYDLKKNKKLEIKDLITNQDSLLIIAEEKFRILYKIPKTASLNSNGFQFEKEKFNLPDNFLVQQDGILFMWNTYQIAPYAMGQINLKLKFREINDLLKMTFLKD